MELVPKEATFMILKITPISISPGDPEAILGPAEGCYYVKITGVPTGVSVGQVIVLLTHTAKKIAETDRRYEFEFAELCPTTVLFGR